MLFSPKLDNTGHFLYNKNNKYSVLADIPERMIIMEHTQLDENERQQHEKFIRMTTGKPEKLICQLAVPSIISMLITSFYNMADTFFIAKLENTSATGAVGVAFSLMAIIQAFGFFLGHGSGNYISRELGKKNLKNAEEMASTGFFTALIVGTFIMTAGLIFINPLAKLLGSTDIILPYAADYIRYILIGCPYMCASIVLNNQLRFQSNAFFGMIGLATGAVLNIALDPIFIFILDMGVSGAAIATIISQFASFVLLLVGMQKSDSLKIRLSNFRPNMTYFVQICKGGAPSLFRQGLGSVASICLNFSAGNYGDSAIAAIGIVSRIMMFASSALIGFGQGFQPVCGFNYGAKLYSRVKRSFVFCVKYASIFLLIFAVVLFVCAQWIIPQFQKEDQQVISIGILALRCQAVTFPFMAWVVMSNMMTQTIGKVYKASLLAMARQGIMFIPCVLILPLFFDIWGLLLAQPAADMLSFILALPLQISEMRELDRLAAENPQ